LENIFNKMDKNKLMYVGFIIGIPLFILGLFDLTERRFGYYSPLMSIALQIMIFCFLYGEILSIGGK